MAYLAFIHLLAMCLGLGGAIFQSVLITRFMIFEKITYDKYRIIQFTAYIIILGTIFLWLSGCLIVFYKLNFTQYQSIDPLLMTKIIIVLILSINGYINYTYILPIIKQNLGHNLFSLNTKKYWLSMSCTAAISIISWLFAFGLGAMSKFPFAFNFSYLISVYIISLLICIYCIYFFGSQFQESYQRKLNIAKSIRSNFYIWNSKGLRHKIFNHGKKE